MNMMLFRQPVGAYHKILSMNIITSPPVIIR